MIHRATRIFGASDYKKLPADIRARADKQFELLKANPQHPSLHFKKFGDRKGQEIWSAQVTLKYRAWPSKSQMNMSGSGLASIMFTTRPHRMT